MKNMIATNYKNCKICKEQAPAKPRQAPVVLHDLTKLWVMELVGVDLMELEWQTFLVMVDKKSGFRFCQHL